MPKFNSISGKILRRLGIHLPVAWEDAQEFEFAHTVEYMKTDTFEDKLEAANSEECAISKGYVHPGILGEYFSGETRDWAEFVKFIDGKTVMEIGPSVASVICQWDVAAKRIVIEPLLDKVRPYQEETFGRTGFTNTIGYSIPAEQRIEELVGQIDGALFIRNCLDHSPQWPFILNNIRDYMAPGAVLLLWTDLIHPAHYLVGHYDITPDVDAFRRLITNLGFAIESEYQNVNSDCLNYGCRAVRI